MPLMLLLGPRQYTAAHTALPVIAAAFSAFCLEQIVNYVFHLCSRLYLPMISAVGAGLAKIALTLLLVPLLGFMGAAWATLIALSLEAVVSLWLARRLQYFALPWLWLAVAAGATLVASAAALALMPWLGAEWRSQPGPAAALAALFALCYLAAAGGGIYAIRKRLQFAWAIQAPAGLLAFRKQEDR